MASLTLEKWALTMAGAFVLLCSCHFLQKAQRSWRCRGSCGLVGLGWEHAKNMCMCIPPSKMQRDINPTQDAIYTLAWVLVNLQATCDLS